MTFFLEKDEEVMRKYIESITKLNQLTLASKPDEIDRYAESDIFWSQNKSGTYVNRKIKKGDIFQFEFGKNYIPEMSYEHRGLVIGISGRLLYVLPIFSYQSSKFTSDPPCHITDNPDSKSDYYLLKKSEFSFLQHDSVIKLNDIRTVSALRIKYSHSSRIAPTSDVYQYIENCVITKYFGSFAYTYQQMLNDNQQLKEENERLKLEIDALKKAQESNN